MPQKTVQIWLGAVAIFVISGLAFLLINKWHEWSQCQQSIPTVQEMNHQIESLVGEILELEVMLEDMEMELEAKADLLEEKNAELSYFQFQIQEMENSQQAESEEVARLKSQLALARKQLQEASTTLESQRKMNGLVYRVQIGMLAEEYLPPLPFAPADFAVEEWDGQQKYLIGSFREYDEAMEFRDAIRRIGLDDAWVVPYLNAERIDNESARTYLAGMEENPNS
jgi:hypothetical protein